jgi:hypothetical protein
MGRGLMLAAGLIAVLSLAPSAAGSVAGPTAYVEVWTGKGEGEIYDMGENIDIYVRPSFDAYVIVYTIDTNGYVDVIFPYDCQDDGYLIGGRDYQVAGDRSHGMRVSGSKGVAYVRALASATPFRRLYWPGCPGYERYADDVSWATFADYWGPALPERISGDPYVAMQSLDEFICWDAVNTGAVSVDYSYYYVMEMVERPVYFVSGDFCLPPTYYWPYWNACWDACWGFSIRFGSYYPIWNPCRWTWCTPTWCAPSWCWPTWYRPAYAHHGPRYSCWPAGGTHRTYPSQVKWKSGERNPGGSREFVGTTPSTTKTKTRTGVGERDLTIRERAVTSAKTKQYSADERAEDSRKARETATDSGARSSANETKSRSARKTYSTEPARTADKKASTERAVSERKEIRTKAATVRSTVEKAVEKTTSKVRKETTTRPSAPKPSSSSRVKSNIRSSSGSSSSSSSGSSGNHRESPKTRRSVSR